ncbi:MAG: UvrD-helicase domain-containing protein [Candidatus Sungbacteria bacterium]|nr:UvrD-helicase domain-containing protein [Candidatus Sungbacteria bacterium]
MSYPLKEKILSELNDKQREAVTATEGPVLIIAGAGSGKTKALTHRVAYLIASGATPSKILAVTFTNKAAEEMRERIRALTYNLQQTTNNRPFIDTFHAFCAHVLRQEYANIGFNKNFTIFDEDDSLGLIKEIMKELNISPKQYPPNQINAIISGTKTQLLSPEEYQENYGQEPYTKIIAGVYTEYQKRLSQANALDFDDLLMKTVRLFREKPEVRASWQKRFTHIHVDEFQDTNLPQYLLVQILSEEHRNIFAIGDDGQAIYGWRGADWRNIFNFERDWPEAKIIFLEQNYRSTQNILEAANHLIRHNVLQKEKNLWTENGTGDTVTATSTLSERHEAGFIAEEIARLVDGGLMRPQDMAILYRTNAQSRALEEALLDCSLPYAIYGGIRFFQRKEIKDIVCYLRFLTNPSDSISLQRIINVPPRGVGVAGMVKGSPSFQKFRGLCGALTQDFKKSAPSQCIKTLLKKINYREYLNESSDRADERWENVQELVSWSTRFDQLGPENGMTKLLEEVSLVALDDHNNHNKTAGGRVSLMTLHAAKGLEFPVVFLAGMEEGILPHAKATKEPSAIEEERRLCYVGITRAQKKLYLTWALSRTIFGDRIANTPSRFLKEIPKEYLEMNEEMNILEDEEYEDEDEELII